MITRPACRPFARWTALARVVAACALLGAGAVPAGASMEEAVVAYRNQDFQRAFTLLQPVAHAGDPRAQAILGLMFAYGEGVRQDDKSSLHWYRLAAEQGYSPAQYAMAEIYSQGRGVEPDVGEALVWYERAAKQGHRDAQRKLGMTRAELASASRVDSEMLPLGPAPVVPGADAAAAAGDSGSSPSGSSSTGSLPAGTASGGSASAGSTSGGSVSNGVRTASVGTGASGAAAARATPESGIPAPDGGPHFVQLGSSRSEADAGRLWRRLQRRHADLLGDVPGGVVRADLGAEKGVWFRVRAGGWRRAANARALCGALKSIDGKAGCYPVTDRGG